MVAIDRFILEDIVFTTVLLVFLSFSVIPRTICPSVRSAKDYSGSSFYGKAVLAFPPLKLIYLDPNRLTAVSIWYNNVERRKARNYETT